MKTNFTLTTITILVIVLSILTSCKKEQLRPIDNEPVINPLEASMYWQGAYKATITRDNSNNESYPWTSLSKYDIIIYANSNKPYDSASIGTKITIPRRVQIGGSDTLSIYTVKPEVSGITIDKNTVKLFNIDWSINSIKHRMCNASIKLNPNDKSLDIEYTDSTISTPVKYFSHYKLHLTKN